MYAPNKDTPIFDKVSDLIANSQDDHVIICGDFNLALDPSLDVNNYKAINNLKLRVLLVNIIKDHNLTDIQQVRLDYIFFVKHHLEYYKQL